MVKSLSGYDGCGFLAAYRWAIGSSPSAWSKGRQPSGAVLHSSRSTVYVCIVYVVLSQELSLCSLHKVYVD